MKKALIMLSLVSWVGAQNTAAAMVDYTPIDISNSEYGCFSDGPFLVIIEKSFITNDNIKGLYVRNVSSGLISYLNVDHEKINNLSAAEKAYYLDSFWEGNRVRVWVDYCGAAGRVQHLLKIQYYP